MEKNWNFLLQIYTYSQKNYSTMPLYQSPKLIFYSFVFFAFLNLTACKTSSNTNSSISNNTESPSPMDKGEKEFEEYLKHKKDKYKGQNLPSATVKTIDGKTYTLADLKGKIVLLNFWFAACKPCVTEIPSLNELHDQYHSKNVLILSVSTDNLEIAKRLATEKKMRYHVAADGKKLAETLEVSSFPTSFLIDKKGVIQEIFIGANDFDATQTYREVKPFLEKLILNE